MKLIQSFSENGFVKGLLQNIGGLLGKFSLVPSSQKYRGLTRSF